MNLQVGIIYLTLLVYFTEAQDLNCLTGYKILVRRSITNQANQKEYKLMNKCLCPNNYFGPSCQFHLDIDCYLNPSSTIHKINSGNIKEQMNFDFDFYAQCWVHPKSRFGNRIQMRKYLSSYNQSNAFGVKEQFGEDQEIIWANRTDIFDQNGQLKVVSQMQTSNSSNTLSENQRFKIIIGQNTKLFEKPFEYQQYFLGFGLINGNMIYQASIINPEKGLVQLANFSSNNVEISNLREYIESYSQFNQTQKQSQQFAKDISNMIKNKTLNQTFINYFNRSSYSKDFNTPDPSPQYKKQLPRFKIPFEINPYNSTFYSAIRIQLIVQEKFQTAASHEVSLNSILWTAQVNVQGLGAPKASQKHLTITDSSDKSYYRIFTAVVIGALVFFGLKYGHKRYKAWKNKQYLQFDQVNQQKQAKIKQNKFQNHEESVRSSATSSTTQQCQLKHHEFNQ